MPEKQRKRVTIVGLGRTGQSIGLALRQGAPSLELVGHDRDPDASRTAQRAGAVHKTHWNLPAACDGAALVILALPAAEVIPTLAALRSELRPGAVVTDTAPIKSPFGRWAKANLPGSVHYVGGHPLAQMPERASADAFEGSVYCLTPPADAEPEAVAAVIQVVDLLRAQPLFLEAEEHDGLMAALQLLPALAGYATLETLLASSALADLQGLSQALPAEVLSLGSLAAAGFEAAMAESERSVLAEWLRRYISLLQATLTALESGDEETMKALVGRLQSAPDRWLGSGQTASSADDASRRSQYWRRMFGMR